MGEADSTGVARNTPKKATKIYSRKEPKWVEADLFKGSNTIATVEAWGERFERCQVKHTPSDRFESATRYVEVRHSSGSWLRVYEEE